ncbi:hypothetical protein Ancab_026737 [Ancistrocladus abbreviatus]
MAKTTRVSPVEDLREIISALKTAHEPHEAMFWHLVTTKATSSLSEPGQGRLNIFLPSSVFIGTSIIDEHNSLLEEFLATEEPYIQIEEGTLHFPYSRRRKKYEQPVLPISILYLEIATDNEIKLKEEN